jgi:hypothetical protein
MSIFCEEYRKPNGATCDYWRVEKADSLIVVPLAAGYVLLPPPEYRPGAGKHTLDLPGGRITDTATAGLIESATQIVSRELSVPLSTVTDIDIIDATGTYVNSSFNNQRLFVAQARLTGVDADRTDLRRQPLDELGQLLKELECLQCAYALTRFMRTLVN